uniref:AsIV-cont00132-ORF2 n=1 Tax=Apophua simplicipes ichnovirus TaxID=1329648 RepID=S5DT50_9VIRU|nr:AsIV-cont00132-ORF2 [Apophua simplicipes ichnovirus]
MKGSFILFPFKNLAIHDWNQSRSLCSGNIVLKYDWTDSLCIAAKSGLYDHPHVVIARSSVSMCLIIGGVLDRSIVLLFVMNNCNFEFS